MLVLSLFPGIGLLDRAFELEGFCVVRGPDLLWGGDIKLFSPPPNRFDGIIGGPPCQAFSSLNQSGRMGLQPLAENLIPEFERVIDQTVPRWFVMENVPDAPKPVAHFYKLADLVFNNRSLGEEQSRARRFTFGIGRDSEAALRWRSTLQAQFVALENPIKSGCFTANGTQWEPGANGRRGRLRSCRTKAELARGIRLQGLPDDFLKDAPFTVEGAIAAVGNGVPIPMGRAVARAVKAALGMATETEGAA
jgi:DNA (cytosine-5)-methyltransferase 1